MDKDPTQKALSADHINVYLASRCFDLVEAFFRYGFVPFFFWLSVKELAGQETIVNVVVSYISKSGNFFPWTLAFVFFVWALAERKVRRLKIKRMSRHLKNVEERLDSKRTSSGLTPTGETPRRNLSKMEER